MGKTNAGLAAEVANLVSYDDDQNNKSLSAVVDYFLQKEKALSSISPEVIADAVIRAMEPEPTLEYYREINLVVRDERVYVSFTHNYLQKLGYRNEAILLNETFLIFDKDNVSVSENGVTFNINPFDNDRGDFAGIIVKTKLRNGEVKYTFVSADHIYKAKSMSKNKDGVWSKDGWFFEMAKKVAIKTAFKGLDISREFDLAVEIDNEDNYTIGKRKRGAKAKSQEASTFEDLMVSGTNIIRDIGNKLGALGVIYRIEDEWVILDAGLSSGAGIDSLKNNGAEFRANKENPDESAIRIAAIEQVLLKMDDTEKAKDNT